MFIKLPFFDAKYENKLRKEFKKIDSAIQPIFIPERPLASLLRNKEPIPCNTDCICDGKNICNAKNIVYRIDCCICNEIYIGETHRTYASRIGEHITRQSSNVYQHLIKTHTLSPEYK